MHELVGHVLAERLPERDLDEVDADRMAHEVGHLPAGDPRCHLDDRHPAVRRGDQLREGDAVAQPERAHGVLRGPLGALELVGVDRGRVDVDPADAEADARAGEGDRRASDGRRRRRGRSTIPFISVPVDEALEDRLARRRLGERDVEVALQVVRDLDPEDRRAGRPSRRA